MVFAALLSAASTAAAQDVEKESVGRARARAPNRSVPAPSVRTRQADDAKLLERMKSALAPHGEWLQHARYGAVWRPNTGGARFVPYLTDGKWVVGDDGQWAWASDREWGNVAMHYGNWVWTRPTGWIWIPGNDYAPAHVVWRLGEKHVGWAPISPLPYWMEDAPVMQASGGLPFWFVSKQHLFDAKPLERVVTDRDLALEIMKNSSIHGASARNVGPSSPAPAALGLSDTQLPKGVALNRDLDKTLDALEAANEARLAGKKPEAPASTTSAFVKPSSAPPTRIAQSQPPKRIQAPQRAHCWYTNTWPRQRICRTR
jgi:hypothetical protein